jgi:hypothetical protein
MNLYIQLTIILCYISYNTPSIFIIRQYYSQYKLRIIIPKKLNNLFFLFSFNLFSFFFSSLFFLCFFSFIFLFLLFTHGFLFLPPSFLCFLFTPQLPLFFSRASGARAGRRRQQRAARRWRTGKAAEAAAHGRGGDARGWRQWRARVR